MKLTKNFSLEEFHCRDGTPIPPELIPNVIILADNLQVLRDDLGVPVHISSGYRHKAYNAKVGGAPGSQHILAKAGDLKAPPFTPKQVADRIESLISQGKMRQGGIGRYPTFTHYDIRAKWARW